MNNQSLDSLRKNALFRQDLLIGGKWSPAESKETFPVCNPATGELIAEVADAGKGDVYRAIAAATEAQPGWAATPVKERSRLIRLWFEAVMAHQDLLALLLTLEQGKPLSESRGEIAYGASYIDWFAEEAKRIYGDVISPPNNHTQITILKQPVGVVAAITPWNFPSAMLARKIAPALAAGCTLVAKPAAETPLSALALGYLAQSVGIPDGVINLVPSTQAELIGHIFCSHPQVRKLTFTGSTAVGKKLIAQSASGVKRISLELGGNAPFIVFEDADLDAAVAGAMASKFRNAGQTCVCANRFYIQQSVYTLFVEKFTVAVSQLRQGNGLDPGINLGPLVSSKAVHKVRGLVEDAVKQGAVIAYETPLNASLNPQGSFYPAQVLTHVKPDMAIVQEEIFGPVAALIPFDSEEQVIEWANASPYGLAAYCYTTHSARIWRLSNKISTGMLGINTGLISNEMAPFGGIKESGWGREGSRYGLDDYLDIKYICQSF